MAEATLVGRTRVSLTPDTSRFGDLLRVELPKAIRQPAILAGDLAGTIITGKIESAVRKMKPVVKVRVDLDTAAAKTRLSELGKTRTVKITADLDDKAAVASLTSLTRDRTVKVTAQLDDKAATAAVTRLTADRTLKVSVNLDEAGAKQRLQGLLGQRTVDVLPKIQQAAYNTAKAQLDKLTADRVVNIRASVDTRVGAQEIRNLIQRRQVRIGVDVDTRVAADSLANLTRRRQMTVQARADTAAATTALRFLTRDRTTTVRIRSVGLSALTLGLANLGGAGGGSSGGVGLLSSRIAKLAAAAVLAFPSMASLASAIAQMGPLAATAAPAVTTLIGAFAAIKIGTSGIGDAIKAAFKPAASEATKAASATKQVEAAQRSLARAQQGVQEAQRQAAERVAQATRQVSGAERDLTRAQRDARQSQADLSAARRQATRDLQDMNQQLASGRLSEEEATLAVQQAELDLQRTRSDPTATQLQIQQAELAHERAMQSLDEQRTQVSRLEKDTAAANKKGIEGSQAVTDAKRQAAAANEQVADRERALAEAQRGVAQAQAEGQRQVADAQQAVADAVRQVADAQQTAATQTSKADDALAKLSPNARTFVGVLQQMAPAWRGMKLDVQDRLFAGIGARLQQVGGQILPTVRTGLVGTAGQLNVMGKNALTAVSNLQKTGQLRQVFDGIRSSLGNLNRVPGQLVTGLAQLSIAAQPAFDRMTAGAAGAMDRVMAKLSTGLENGKLEETINTALDVAIEFGKVLADLGGIFKAVFAAASEGSGGFFTTIGAALAEIRRVLELPEVKTAMTQIFSGIAAIAGLLATTLGAVLQAVMPLLAALAPIITALANALGPVLAQLAQSIGAALMPIITALLPIIDMVGMAVIDIVSALTPLLQPIGQLIAMIVSALVPVLQPIIAIVVQVVQALAGPLTTVIQSLMPYVVMLGELFSQVFGALTPVITPLVGVIGEIAGLLAGLFAQAIGMLIPLITPLIPLITMIVKAFGQLLISILRPLMPVITQVAGLIGQILGVAISALTPVLTSMVGMFMQLLPSLQPLMPAIVELITAVGQLIPPLLQLVLTVLTPLLPLISQLAVLLTTGLSLALQALVPIVVQVMVWIIDFATLIAKAVRGIVKVFQWLFDVLLGHSIIPDIARGALKWFTSMWKGAVEIFTNLKDGAVKIWDALWDRVRRIATGAWRLVKHGFGVFVDALKGAFRRARDSLGEIWNGIKALVKAPIKFWVDVVYNQGIVKVWNKTAAKIPGVPDLKPMKGFARGGILPGFSTWRDGDDQLVPMRRGEGVYVSEAMRDPYERARLHAVNQAAMAGRSLREFRGFSIGGVIGDVGSGIKDGVGKALGKGADVVRGGLADLAEKAFSPVKTGIRKALGTNKNTFRGMIGQAPIGHIEKAIEYIRGKDIIKGSFGGQWMKPVNAGYGTRFGVKGRMWSSGRHTGLDFPAKTGTKIVAVDDGTVSSATSGGPYGKHVTISHGGGLSSLYAHMSAIAARAGASIRVGSRVGSVGATGNVTGPHLHLEARLNGRTVDPMKYLTGGGDIGGSGVQRWKGVVQQALSQVRQSLSLTGITLRRMNQESGGNPKAVNKWDINWQRGHPSVGLMQVIRGTFDQFAGKYRNTGPKMYGVSIDPMANIYASMKYALRVYGSLSRAYGRPGGYAKGGILRGLRVHRGLRGGFASGGIIRVGGKRINTGPLAAAVGGDFLKQLAGTASQIDKAMTKVATAIKNAFKGVKTTLDNRLLAQVSKQNKMLQSLAKQRDEIAAKITAAKTLATDSTDNALQFAQMTSLPNGGNTFDASGILSGLNVRLGQIKKFGANLQTLNRRGLSKSLMQQIISAGPDGGAAYAQALVDATPDQLKQINAAQTGIEKAAGAFGKDAADAMYDSGVSSGKGYLTGLASTQKLIEAQMKKIAKAIQKTIKVELKIKSPSQVLRTLGRFTGLGYSGGVADTIPQARQAAQRMASTVRATTAATSARIQSRQTINNGGDRHLHYQATTREVASRQSVLDALAIDDLLHRTVMT